MVRDVFFISLAILIPLVLIVAPQFGQRHAVGTGLPLTVIAPPDNATTPGKVALGKLLFWDPILSGNRDVACATCHHPQFGYSDHRDLSLGVQAAKRNSPTVVNVAFNGMDENGQYTPASAPMFWDLRAHGLEAQALEPLKSFEEMRGNAYSEDEAVETVIERLNEFPEYRSLFAKEFGGENPVNAANLAKALAAFQRSLTANNSPFDRYMRGDLKAMTRAQIRGMRRFERIGCANCHSGPMFSDYQPHILGVPDNRKLPESDAGVKEMPYGFRTASLRNLAYTAPYMHNGVFETLEEVMEFYDDAPENPHVGRRQVDPFVRGLDDPDREARSLIAFLNALNDDSFDKTIPSHVPSGLTPGGHAPVSPDLVRSAAGSRLSR